MKLVLMESVLKDLNSQQREAILHTGGPLLIFAGAGSGKTKVIAHKFSYLVKSKGHLPDSIFAVAFTNKAAHEMRERIGCLLEKDMDVSWMGTFHSLCNRILKKEIRALGYRNNFSIYDEDDQCNLLRHILKELKMHEAIYRGMASRICSLKSSLIGLEEFLSSGDGFGFDEKIAKVYVRYQDELRRSNALDFDDLIMLTVKLLESDPRLLEKYQDMFSYILVDDFQDTNYAQYCLLKLLAQARKRICVVADDDQSIFKFKGADLNNIFNFEKDFPGVKIIKLEQNYRSTQNILTVSNSVISQNSERRHKKLWTVKGLGEKVYSCWFHTYEEEAQYIAKVIKELYLKGRYNYTDFAIFFRVNSQSKAIEDALRDEGLPYRVFGGVSFYQKKEIKDIIGYMRLVMNHGDNVSFRRVINCPPRGIGTTALSRIEQEAKKKSISLYDANKATLRSDSFTPAVKERLAEFVKLVEALSSAKYKTAAEMFKNIVAKSGYAEILDEKRSENVRALISSAEGKEIKEFLDKVSLSTSMDEINKGDYISLMTLHSVKGLEFPVVFIVGLEEGLLPYCKAIEGKDEIAEERRLFYVGMTRAKDRLWLTGASKRKFYTKLQEQEPSRFLKDIPQNCCQWIEKIKGYKTIKLEPTEKNIEPKYPFTLYAAGCRVKHPTWGIGVVRDCYGDGEEQKVTVNFPNIGLKRLSVKFAHLQRI